MAPDSPSPLRTPQKLRQLSAQELGLLEQPVSSDGQGPDKLELLIDPKDTRLAITKKLLDEFGGVIFTGPPGTGKSWYARQIAIALTDGEVERSRFVQFHQSYQYEDFVEGFVPQIGGGFVLEPKHLLDMAERAQKDLLHPYVIVIDELSRGDPARIFGEALTYVERTKRGLKFQLSSGSEESIPPNLLFLATMNPLDRGVDEVDAAFERRFAKIAYDPDVGVLGQFLDANGVAPELKQRVVIFFQTVQARARDNPYARIGHTFFLNVHNETDLRDLWDYQLRFVFDKAYKLEPQGFQEIKAAWDKMTPLAPPVAAEQTGAEGPAQA